MNIVCITQARMESERFPGKVVEKLYGQPMILWHCLRIMMLPHVVNNKDFNVSHIVATSSGEKTLSVLQPLLSKHDIYHLDIIGVDNNDVLGRFFHVAHFMAADIVIRLCGDCPFVDPYVIKRALSYHLSHKNDLTALSYEWPDGLDVEVINIAALDEAFHNAKLPHEREHVTPYLWNKDNKYTVGHLKCPLDLSNQIWSIDTQEDLDIAENIMKILYPIHRCEFSWLDIYGVTKDLDFTQERNKSYLQQICSNSDWRSVRYGND